MEKMTILSTATGASVAYFIVAVILKYSPNDKILDWENALIGAIAVWIIIFFLHQFVYKQTQS